MTDDDNGILSPNTHEPATAITFTPAIVNQLIQLGVQTARTGNKPEARALFRALARRYPKETRVWLWLAGVAETYSEQQQALEQVLLLEPEHPLARQGLARLHTRMAAAVATPTPPVVPVPPEPVTTVDVVVTPQAPRAAYPRWLYVAVGLLGVLLLFWLMRIGMPGGRRAVLPIPTPTLFGQALLAPTESVAATAMTLESMRTPSPVPALPSPTIPPPMAPLSSGNLLEYADWQATLLRPDYARVVEGSVAGIQPAGQFVIVLLAVSNTSDVPRLMPPDLFALIDEQGQVYTPDQATSTAYLELYARGQWGDLAIDDVVPPGGLYSIPLLFDVPLSVTSLFLIMGQQMGTGWPVLETTPASEPPIQTDEAAAET